MHYPDDDRDDVDQAPADADGPTDGSAGGPTDEHEEGTVRCGLDPVREHLPYCAYMSAFEERKKHVGRAHRQGREAMRKPDVDVDPTQALAERPLPKTPNRRLKSESSSRKSLAGAGTVTNAQGVRRSTRDRLNPLEWWRNECVVYSREESKSAHPHCTRSVPAPHPPQQRRAGAAPISLLVPPWSREGKPGSLGEPFCNLTAAPPLIVPVAFSPAGLPTVSKVVVRRKDALWPAPNTLKSRKEPRSLATIDPRLNGDKSHFPMQNLYTPALVDLKRKRRTGPSPAAKAKGNGNGRKAPTAAGAPAGAGAEEAAGEEPAKKKAKRVRKPKGAGAAAAAMAAAAPGGGEATA